MAKDKKSVKEKLSSTKFLLSLVAIAIIALAFFLRRLSELYFIIGVTACTGGYEIINFALTTLMPGIVKRNGQGG